MIKFFRHIRQRMIKDNKVSKYLLYALGEIVLVVIGILIALQVNEWNNERNRNLAEAVIITQLKTDLETSSVELEEIKEFYLIRAQACAEVTQAFYKTEFPHDSIEDALNSPFSARIYSPILGTARSLINSGNIDRLRSTQLKSDLIAYVEKVDYLLKDISRYEESYYRTGVSMMQEVMPSTFRSVEYMDSLVKDREKNDEWYTYLHKEGMSMRPLVIERVPFKSELNELFQNQKHLSA